MRPVETPRDLRKEKDGRRRTDMNTLALENEESRKGEQKKERKNGVVGTFSVSLIPEEGGTKKALAYRGSRKGGLKA